MMIVAVMKVFNGRLGKFGKWGVWEVARPIKRSSFVRGRRYCSGAQLRDVHEGPDGGRGGDEGGRVGGGLFEVVSVTVL